MWIFLYKYPSESKKWLYGQKSPWKLTYDVAPTNWKVSATLFTRVQGCAENAREKSIAKIFLAAGTVNEIKAWKYGRARDRKMLSSSFKRTRNTRGKDLHNLLKPRQKTYIDTFFSIERCALVADAFPQLIASHIRYLILVSPLLTAVAYHSDTYSSIQPRIWDHSIGSTQDMLRVRTGYFFFLCPEMPRCHCSNQLVVVGNYSYKPALIAKNTHLRTVLDINSKITTWKFSLLRRSSNIPEVGLEDILRNTLPHKLPHLPQDNQEVAHNWGLGGSLSELIGILKQRKVRYMNGALLRGESRWRRHEKKS